MRFHLPSAFFALALIAQFAPADVLVTHNGERIETQGPWEVKGRQVIFTTPGGVLSALRLDDVDLEASRLASQPPPPPPPPEENAPPPPPPVLVLTNDDLASDDLEAAMGELGQVMGEALGAMTEQMLRAFGSQGEEMTEQIESEVGGDLGQVVAEGMSEAMSSLSEALEASIEIGRELSALDQQHDFATADGMAASGSRLSALGAKARRRAQGATPESREMLDGIAAQIEELADLARRDPQAAAALYRERKAANED